jgi:hypothetical protein
MPGPCGHPHCTLCGQCLTCSPHPPHTRGCSGARSNGGSFGPDRMKRPRQMVLLDEAQVTFWKLI